MVSSSVWACEYLSGLDWFRPETDHKLVNSQSLDNVPLLMRYRPKAAYVHGETPVVANALSQSTQTYKKGKD